MCKPVIDFKGAKFSQGGTARFIVNGAVLTRAIQRIELADGTRYQKNAPDWCWEKWIGDKFSRQHSKNVPGHWWRCTTMHAWILDRVWRVHCHNVGENKK
ncbi:hypothetical protein [Pantoea sp. BAV 3049]|uniref:hypothetical protein n=1 Tax=Pantoea sp. BAV 3049 TaxID=2654188 RepID=UPI00131EC93C|nr:hypothetical protein [Pantoea sp. BAV 3049]